MDTPSTYGLLLNKDIKLHRQYFKEMCKLIGINVIFKAPIEETKYNNMYGELNASYDSGIVVGCIFQEHPDQKTLKRMGWVSELQDNSSIIHLPFDLLGLQQGALVIVPSGIDSKEGRLFRIINISNIMIYPASYACEIAPEYENTFEKSELDHKHSDFNLLRDDEEES